MCCAPIDLTWEWQRQHDTESDQLTKLLNLTEANTTRKPSTRFAVRCVTAPARATWADLLAPPQEPEKGDCLNPSSRSIRGSTKGPDAVEAARGNPSPARSAAPEASRDARANLRRDGRVDLGVLGLGRSPAYGISLMPPQTAGRER